MAQSIRLVKYSEKSVAVYGDFTSEQKEFFTELKGLYNGRLREGPGYIFKLDNKGALEKFLRIKESPGAPPPSPAGDGGKSDVGKPDLDNQDESPLPKLLLKRSNAQVETQLDRIESLLKSINTRLMALDPGIVKFK